MAMAAEADTSLSSDCLFSARIVNIDFYVSPPLKDLDVSYSEFRSAATEKVPVIRIFGATPLGQKTCLHLHCVFPYLFVPCPVADPTDAYLRQLARSADNALQLSLGVASKPAVHVYKIMVVKGIPLYGYHATEELFLKIYLYNPVLVKRLSDLLLAGAVMNTTMQPHESHIPYVLQVMIDYNLFGMGFIHLSAVRFRLGTGEQNPTQSSTHSHSPSPSLTSPSLSPSCTFVSPSQMHWDVNTLPSTMVHCVPRASVCDLEVDALAVNILNRQELSMASGSYPGLVAIWEEERQRRRLLGNEVPLTPPASPDHHSPSILPTERRLRVEFDEIVKERLGLSSDSEPEKSPTPSSMPYSQSCDIEQHRPISRENSDVIARQPTGEEKDAVVNEELVHRSMELSQRLSPEAIRTSTDAELLELLLDLAHTPQDQASQSLYSSQSISQSLSSKLLKSQSVASGSLFSSLAGSPSSAAEAAVTQTVGLADNNGSAKRKRRKTESTCSTEPLNILSPIGTLTSDDELFDSSPEAPIEDASLVNDNCEDNMDISRVSLHEKSELDPKLHSRGSTPVGHSGSEPTQRSFHSGLSDASFALSLDSDDSRHSLADALKSPRATEEEPESPKEDLDLIGSQFDIPCAQLMPESSSTAGPREDATLASLAQELGVNSQILRSHSNSQAAGQKPSGDDIQLEYDISNVNISQFESSNDQLLSILESPPALEMQLPNFSTSHFDSAQIPPVQLSELQRRSLMRLCSGDPELEGDLLQEKSSSEESEDEDEWLSQHGWDDDSSSKQQPLERPTAEGSMHEVDALLDVRDDRKVEESFNGTIPQLDGSGDVSRGGRRRKITKKTLGVKRKHQSQNKQLLPKEDSFQSMVTTHTLDHHSLTSASTAETNTLQSASGSKVAGNSPKKARPSLSLKKRSKDMSPEENKSRTIEQSKESSGSSQSMQRPLQSQDRHLKQKALDHSNKLHLRLVKIQHKEEKIGEYFHKINKRSTSSLSEDETATEQTSKKKPKTIMQTVSCVKARGEKSKSKPQSSPSPSNSQSKPLILRGMKTRSMSTSSECESISSSPNWTPYSLKNYTEEELLQMAIAESLKTATPFPNTCSTITTGLPSQIASSNLDISITSDHQSPQPSQSPLPLITHGNISTTVVAKSSVGSEPEDFGRYTQLFVSPLGDEQHCPLKARAYSKISDILSDEEHFPATSSQSEPETELEESDFHLALVVSSSEDSPGNSDGEEGGPCNRSLDSVSKLHEAVTLSHVRQSQRGDPHSIEGGVMLQDLPGICKKPRMMKPLSESEDTLSASEGEGQGEWPTGVYSKSTVATSQRAAVTFQQTETVRMKRRNLLAGPAPHAVAPTAGSSSEETLSASEGEGLGEGVTGGHSRSPKAASGWAEAVMTKRRDLLSGPTLDSAVTTESDSEETLSTSEGEGQREGSVGSENGFQHAVVTIQRKEEVRMKKTDLLSGSSLSEKRDFGNGDLLKTTTTSGDETFVREKIEQTRAVLLPLCRPPTSEEVMKTAVSHGLPQVVHRRPFYGRPADVQPAKDVGGRAVKVPSKMAYELPEFEPRYWNETGSSTRFSQMGLEQWRAIFSLESGTQPVLPPPCHPHGVARDLKPFPGGHYTSADHQKDVELRAAFFRNEATVITPVLLPPHPGAVAEWYECCLRSLSTNRLIVGDIGKTTEGQCCKTQAGVSSTCLPAEGSDETATTLIVSSSQTLTQAVGSESRDTAVKKANLEPIPRANSPLSLSKGETEIEIPKASPSSTPSSSQVAKEITFEEMLKSPGSIQSDSSADNMSVYSVTSYQVPISLLENPVSEGLAESSSNDMIGEKTTEPSSQGDNKKRNLLVTCEKTPQGHVPATAHPRHSTPMVGEGERVGGGASTERVEREATPVRMKDLRVDCPSSERIRLPFTPITQLKKETSQLEGPTPNNTYGFKLSQSALPGACGNHEVQHLTCMSLELHARTRGTLRPDPEFDPILAVFYYIHNDWTAADGSENCRLGVIAIDVDNHPVKEAGESPGKKKKSPVKGSHTPQSSPLKGSHTSPLKEKQSTASPAKTKSPKKTAKSPGKTPPHRGVSLGKQGRVISPLIGDKEAAVVAGSQLSSNSAPRTADCAAVGSGAGSSEGVRRDGESSAELNLCLTHCGLSPSIEVSYATSEVDLIEHVVQLVRKTDPDFLIGYEVIMTSWGYLIDRAATLNINLVNELSRMPNLPGVKSAKGVGSGARRPSDLHILGRTVINVWKIMRHEIALNTYSYENVYYHVLHQRVPVFSHQTLTRWYQHNSKLYRYRVVGHYIHHCHGNYQLLEKFNVICRTSEFARLYGIEFESVLSRGSQYRVESMLLRLAKPANFIAVSPSVQQRARMAAPECIPLILEPESKFYVDPVVLLDFQSLYPSIIIGHNYCFTTCLGKLRNLALHGDFTFGTNSLSVPPHVLSRIKDDVSISPNGVVFVKPNVRKGLMPRMLEEILGTRIMVKNSMKQHKGNKALGRMLDARQLGLKLIANVTYGYTAASFSGRMPCIEIGDSIVRKARETLERAIQLVNSTPEWRARVVYGATDSLFVLLKGAPKEEAFRIGREICRRVTADNPKPVKLKFEKVYLPCILQTKQRYVGFMYESEDQVEPQFDAKGIETVRRDTCPAVAKVLEKSLRILFTTRDLSLVKTYVQRQCSKLLDGHVNIQDYTFAKEYRGRSNYRPGACVPALELAKRNLTLDRRSEPRPGERVPYVVVYGGPGQPLIQLVRDPREVARDPTLRLNGTYYITKQILPALDRAFSLVGVDVRQWYTDLPRVFRAPVQVPQEANSKRLKGTIGQYFATMHCPICEALTVDSICTNCRADPQKVAVSLNVRIQAAEKEHSSITQLCQNCVGSLDPDYSSKCISLDCPIFYRLHRTKHELAAVATPFRSTLQKFL